MSDVGIARSLKHRISYAQFYTIIGGSAPRSCPFWVIHMVPGGCFQPLKESLQPLDIEAGIV